MTEDDRLGLLVLGHGDREVDISCRSRLSSRTYGKTANETLGITELPEVGGDTAESRPKSS